MIMLFSSMYELANARPPARGNFLHFELAWPSGKYFSSWRSHLIGAARCSIRGRLLRQRRRRRQGAAGSSRAATVQRRQQQSCCCSGGGGGSCGYLVTVSLNERLAHRGDRGEPEQPPPRCHPAAPQHSHLPAALHKDAHGCSRCGREGVQWGGSGQWWDSPGSVPVGLATVLDGLSKLSCDPNRFLRCLGDAGPAAAALGEKSVRIQSSPAGLPPFEFGEPPSPMSYVRRDGGESAPPLPPLRPFASGLAKLSVLSSSTSKVLMLCDHLSPPPPPPAGHMLMCSPPAAFRGMKVVQLLPLLGVQQLPLAAPPRPPSSAAVTWRTWNCRYARTS